MRMMMNIELSRHVEAEVEVDFVCTSLGCPGDMVTPPEGPEFEVTGVSLVWLFAKDEHGIVWEKPAVEVYRGGWGKMLEPIINDLVDEEPDLYELMYDEYAYGDPN